MRCIEGNFVVAGAQVTPAPFKSRREAQAPIAASL
jgi:hypothetical protein